MSRSYHIECAQEIGLAQQPRMRRRIVLYMEICKTLACGDPQAAKGKTRRVWSGEDAGCGIPKPPAKRISLLAI